MMFGMGYRKEWVFWAVSHIGGRPPGKRPWRILRYQSGLWSSYLGSSALPLILWDTHSILPINFPFAQARRNPFQMLAGLKKNVITNMSMSLKNFLFGFLNWSGFVPTASERKSTATDTYKICLFLSIKCRQLELVTWSLEFYVPSISLLDQF